MLGEFDEGASQVIPFTVLDRGVAIDISGWTIEAEFKRPNGSSLEKSSTDSTQIALTDPTNGKGEVYLTQADSIGFAGNWRWKLYAEDTVGRGYILIRPDDVTCLASGL